MATTTQTFTGDGVQTSYTIAFPYRTTADVKATIDAVATTAFTVSGSTVTFTTAPANNSTIVLFRETNNATIEADFQSGSALRAVDLNDNFTQLLFVTQESTNTSNTASTDASNAVSTANTASANATTAVNTANTADANATTALNTANTADTNASTALSTANTALSNSSTAISTANSATTTANTALSTANTADTNASAAVTTANTADTNATAAVNTANTASATATAAQNAVASAVLYDPVGNVASIPSSPSDGDYIEVNDSTGIESFTPLSGLPAGFVGDSGLVVRLRYTTTPSTTWTWQNYFASDSETRYIKDNAAQIVDADINAAANIDLTKLATGALPSAITVESSNIVDGTIVDDDISGSAAISLGKLANGALPTGITVDTTNILNGSITDADISSTASIAVTKLANASPNQLLQTDPTGSFVEFASNIDIPGTLDVTAAATFDSNASFAGGNASAPGIAFNGDADTGIYSPGADQVAISTNGTGRLFVDSSGNVGVGTASPSVPLEVSSSSFDSFKVARTGVGAGAKIGIVNGDGNEFQIIHDGDESLVFRYGSSAERMRIDSSGNVGVGTTSPSTNFEVQSASNTTIRIDNEDDSTAQLYFHNTGSADMDISVSSGNMTFNQSSTELVRIDSSGRLLVGTSTAPTAATTLVLKGNSGSTNTQGRIHIQRSGVPGDGDFLGDINFMDTSNGVAGAIGVARDGGTWTAGSSTPGRLVFLTTADGASSPTERMRISANGYIHFGPSAPSPGNTETVRIQTKDATNRALVLRTSNSGSSSYSLAAFLDGDSDVCGQIVINAYANTTNFSTVSDYRLKDNIGALPNPISRIKQLNPCSFNFISAPDTRFDGFIAHEAQTVVPEAVTGEKDAVDDEGNPVYQGIDQSKLVPLLTAALQEAVAKIESLEARLTAAGI